MRTAITVSLLVLLAVLPCILGHAVLTTPRPWNTSPSKSANCGGGTKPTRSPTTWVAGSTVAFKWTMIAGDGNGPVTIRVDPGGGSTTFPVTIGTTADFQAVQAYDFSFTLPANLTCNRCTIQAKSTSNWYSCASVDIVAPGTPIPEVPQTCTVYYGYRFCNARSGLNVVVDQGETQQQVFERDAGSVYNTHFAYLNNTNVMANGNDARCVTALKNYLCADAFPVCGTKGSCKTFCDSVIQYCGVQESHLGLFPCAELQDRCSASSIPIAVTLLVAVLLAVFLL